MLIQEFFNISILAQNEFNVHIAWKMNVNILFTDNQF